MPSIPVNQLVLPAGGHTIPFEWHTGTIHGKQEPYAALLIPVTLPGQTWPYYMQFDLGSPFSMFYKEELKNMQIADTASRLFDYHFKAGNMDITAKDIPVRSSGHSAAVQDSLRIIGTIGADLIDGRMVIIDYPGKTLFVGDTLPDITSATLIFSPFVFAGRKVLLPAIIRGKRTLLYFDTGSSAYELLTDETTCRALAMPGTAPLEYPVNSWGRTLTAHMFTTKDSITVASQTMPVHHVTYITGASNAEVQQMMKMGIGGVTGNRLFLNSIVILDTRQKRFGIIYKPGRKE